MLWEIELWCKISRWCEGPWLRGETLIVVASKRADILKAGILIGALAESRYPAVVVGSLQVAVATACLILAVVDCCLAEQTCCVEAFATLAIFASVRITPSLSKA